MYLLGHIFKASSGSIHANFNEAAICVIGYCVQYALTLHKWFLFE